MPSLAHFLTPRVVAALVDPAPSNSSGAVFRVDKFVVPAAALEVFLTRLRQVHALLVELPGSLQRHILTQTGGPGEFNVVTLLEWADAGAMAAAQEIVQKSFAAEGYDPQKMLVELGIRADQGFYRKA